MEDFSRMVDVKSAIELGEGQFIEFKEAADKNLAREMVAFANSSGGFIYLGITDTCNIKGVETSNKLKSQIQDTARNCDPPLAILLLQQENVLIIEVKEGVSKPYSCASGFYMRMGANSQKMSRDEILSLAIKTGKIRYDEQICPHFDWRDFDEDKFEYYLKLARISNNLPKEEILRNLRVLTSDGMTNAGVLYFAKQPYKYIISSKIRCIHFNDDERVDILDKKEVDRGIIGNIEYAITYLKELVPIRFEIKDLKRDEYPEYPIEAYREAIVNAIIHFDYFLGDTIAIEKLKTRIIINNKGELLFPKSEFGKKSESRNRLLVDLLARTDFMEKAGTGINRVTNACVENGNQVQFEFSDSFWITIKSNVPDIVPDIVPDNVPDNVRDKRIYLVLDLIKKNNQIQLKELSKTLKVSTRTIRRDIEKLKSMNSLKRIGSEKSGFWKIINDDN